MAVFDLHYPWVFTFGILGNIISFFVYFAPLPTFIRIYKEKSTLGYQSLPYVVALFSATLWMYYAFLKPNTFLLISINSFGCVIESIYIFIYLFYGSKKARKDTAKALGLLNVGLLSLIFLSTFFLKGSIRVQVVGWICVAVSVCVFAAPLSIVFQVIRTKSVEFMPFTLSFFLTLSAIMWFGYGLLQKDLCIALPNVLGFLLGMIQMLLYGMYRSPKQIEVEKKPQPEYVIDIGILGSAEVHPIDHSQKGGSDDEVVVAREEEKQQQQQQEEEEEVEVERSETNNCDVDLGGNESELMSQDCRTSAHVDAPVLVVCAA